MGALKEDNTTIELPLRFVIDEVCFLAKLEQVRAEMKRAWRPFVVSTRCQFGCFQTKIFIFFNVWAMGVTLVNLFWKDMCNTEEK